MRATSRLFSAVGTTSSSAKVWIDKGTKLVVQGFTGKQVGVFLFLLGLAVLGHTTDRSSSLLRFQATRL
jgi:hypothetical protein